MEKSVRFGLDFGTTNSACCYFNRERNAFDYLRFDNQTREFFPTIIAYRKDDDSVRYIGEMAKHYMLSSKYDVYENFKLSLGQNAEEKNGRRKSPGEVARDFLEEVINRFQEKSGQPINNLVMTVPDIWKNEEKNKIAVDHLMDLYEKLGFEAEEQVRFESEPVSAVAYYCREVCQDAYNGFAVVVDYGGGTLDLTLCQVKEGRQIVVLRRCGDGGSGEGGCAGTAFDAAMTQRIIEQYGLEKETYHPGGKNFLSLRNAFEDAKIASTKATEAALRRYYTAYDKSSGISYDDQIAFSVTGYGLEEDYDVKASDIAEVFARVNAKALENALNIMKGYCRELSVDTDSQENFRVLMVGGFSNLYCVESKVRQAFDSLDGVRDLRFDENMRIEARSTAVAHGAAIIAEGWEEIIYFCPGDIGFYYYDVFSESEKAAVLIEKDRPVKDYREPQYFEGILRISSFGKTSSIRLFFDDGGGRIPVKMDETLLELCPNAQVQDNTFQIGFSMGKHRIPMIHVRDRSGEVRTESLNRVLEKISLHLKR